MTTETGSTFATTFVAHEVRYFNDAGECVHSCAGFAPPADTALAAFGLVIVNGPAEWPASWAAGKVAIAGEAFARWHVAPHPEGWMVVEQTPNGLAYIAAEVAPNSWDLHPATARAVDLAPATTGTRH